MVNLGVIAGCMHGLTRIMAVAPEFHAGEPSRGAARCMRWSSVSVDWHGVYQCNTALLSTYDVCCHPHQSYRVSTLGWPSATLHGGWHILWAVAGTAVSWRQMLSVRLHESWCLEVLGLQVMHLILLFET